MGRWVSLRGAKPFVLLLSMTGLSSLSAKELGELDFDYVGYVDSAYVSRGKIVEDRPIEANLVTVYTALGPFGDVGVWHWNYHSLTPRQRDVADRMFREVDWAVCYRNSYEFTEGWRLTGDIQPRWFYFPYLHHNAKDTSWEWWAQLALRNPFLTPSVIMRRGIRPDFTYFQPAFSKPLQITDSLVFTPAVIFDLGNERTFEQRYGKLPNGDRYIYGFQAVHFRLGLDYVLNEYVSFFCTISQFDLMSAEARRQTTGRCPKKDWLYATLGVRLHY